MVPPLLAGHWSLVVLHTSLIIAFPYYTTRNHKFLGMRYVLSSRYGTACFNTRLLSLLLRDAICCSHGAYELTLGVLSHQKLLGRAQAVGAAWVPLSPRTVRSEEAVALAGTLGSLLP